MTVTHLNTHLADTVNPDDVVPSADVATSADITYRQLDHWTRAGYLHDHKRIGTGPGLRRGYSRHELAVACLMRQFVNAGVNPQAAATYARELLTTGATTIAGITLHLPDDH